MTPERIDSAFPDFLDRLPAIFFRSEGPDDWRLVWVSGGCHTLLAYSPEELLSSQADPLRSAVFPSSRREQLNNIAELGSGDSYSLEYPLSTRSGGKVTALEHGRFVRDADGSISGAEGMITDVTIVHDRDRSLIESANRLRGIFENSAEGIFQSRADGTYIDVNPALARIYGFASPAEMMESLTDIGQQLYVDPSRREEFVALLETTDRVAHFTSRVYRRDGEEIWISENARAVRDSTGALLYYEGTIEEITERKCAQDALSRERNMLRTVIDAWPDIIYVKDTQGYYTLSNLAHTKNLGLTAPSEIVGRKPEDFFLPRRATRLSEEDFEVMRSGVPIVNREEVRIADNDEQRWFLTAKLPLRDAEGIVTGLVSLSRDITQHKQTTEQLRQSQKMEAIGRLAGGIAHDFNNILTTIIGFSELIAAYSTGNADIGRDIGYIHAGAIRASALTQQLLAFSRKQVTIKRSLNLNRVITGMEMMLRRLIGEHIRFELQLADTLSSIAADPHQMEQVVMNLVVNARDAVRDGGQITIETSQVYLDGLSGAKQQRILPGMYVRMKVSDDGCGIPKELHDRIFEPFFTTKDQGKGTGLGLATVYGILEQSGGHIFLESARNAGTTFSVYLPTASVSECSAPPEENCNRDKHGKEVVLIAEDDPSIRELTSTILKDLGYHVLVAEDGQAALDLLALPDTPRPHLLITDVVMPRLGGKGLADKVTAMLPDTRILFASGYNEEEVLHRGIQTESVAFISKPFSVDAFLAKVRQVLETPMHAS